MDVTSAKSIEIGFTGLVRLVMSGSDGVDKKRVAVMPMTQRLSRSRSSSIQM